MRVITTNQPPRLHLLASPRVITNNQPRRLHLLAALPPRIQREFEYISIDDDLPRMVQYRGVWYDVCDSVYPGGLPADNPLRAWDALISDSFFSGVVFRHVGDDVVCGRWLA